MFGSKSKQTKVTGRVDTLVGRGASIQGDMLFGGGLHLDGRIIGNVRTEANSAATLWVSEQGTIEGQVEVPNIVLNGTVIGDIHARERLVMGVKARVQGNVYYGVIEMSPGAEVSGKLVPTSASQTSAEMASGGNAKRDAAESKVVAGVFDARGSRT